MDEDRKKFRQLRRRERAKRTRRKRLVDHNISDSELSASEPEQASDASGDERQTLKVLRVANESDSDDSANLIEGDEHDEPSGSDSEMQVEVTSESDVAGEDLLALPEQVPSPDQSEESSSNDEDQDALVPPSDSSDASEPDEADNSEPDRSDEAESEAAASDESDNDGDLDGDRPIYDGAPISLHESLLAIFTLMATEYLSGTLVGKILTLIALHCPANSIIKKTLHTFKSYFVKLGSCILVFHYFCSECMYPIETKESICTKCKKGGENASFFLELPLLDQLQKLFSRHNFYEDLHYRFNENRKRIKENIEDIYDGRIYQEQMAYNGFLSQRNNISFMWYTDGVKVFKSCSYSIWPMCLVINELSYKKRTLPDNILLVGLWFGRHQPNPNIFLRPLHTTMKKFEKEGYHFKLPDNSEILVKGKIICGTCDLPAKAKFLRFKQFNGEFGCARCLSRGGRTAVNKTTVQVYPYTPTFEKRSHEETQEHARQALNARKRDKNASVYGVKGPSLLSKMVPDIIRCTAVDVLHGVFIGVCKLLMTLWFDSSFSSQTWTLCHVKDLFDEKLAKIKPPSHAVRAPRKLKELKFWKGSEYKLFLLYYSIPILKNLMEDVYLQHHCKLVSAVLLLSQDSIALDQIEAASFLLSSYVADFSELYAMRFMGINVHQLLHLSEVVLDLGPLFVYSTFFLESFNGRLSKCFHGNQHIAFQICSSVSMCMQMPIFKKSLPPDCEVLKFCDRLESSSKPFKLADIVDNITAAVGKYERKFNRVQHSRKVIKESLNIVEGQCCIFYRLKRKGVMYFSEEYSFVSKRNESSYVNFVSNVDAMDIGRVVRFVRWSACKTYCDNDCRNCPASYYALINIFERCHWFIHDIDDIRVPNMWRVKKTDKVTAVPVQSLISLCFFIPINDEYYVASPVNRLEIE